MTYEVLKCEGKTGLTLGARVLAPGQKFSSRDWPYGDDALKAAIENKRCKEIRDGLEIAPVKKEATTETPETNGKVKKKEATTGAEPED